MKVCKCGELIQREFDKLCDKCFKEYKKQDAKRIMTNFIKKSGTKSNADVQLSQQIKELK